MKLVKTTNVGAPSKTSFAIANHKQMFEIAMLHFLFAFLLWRSSQEDPFTGLLCIFISLAHFQGFDSYPYDLYLIFGVYGPLLQETRMRDRFTLYAKGGDGGNGSTSFRRSRHDRRGEADGEFSLSVSCL